MAKAKHKHIKLRIGFFVLLVVIILGAFILSICFLRHYNSTYEICINSERDLINVIRHSDRTRSKYNYSIASSVNEPISIDINEIPHDVSFYGHLNGNGNTIIITGDANESMLSPLFDRIQEGAIVERLTVRVAVKLGEDDNPLDVALLANENYGLIKDCAFYVNNLYIGSKCKNASAVVNENFGEINSVCVCVDKVESSQSKDNWQCYFGAIATTNFETVKNVFLDITMDNLGGLNGKNSNKYIGYIFSKVGERGLSKTNNIYLFGGCEYWSRSVDLTRFSPDMVDNGKPNKSQILDFINRSGSQQNAWSNIELDEVTGFPKLNKNK